MQRTGVRPVAAGPARHKSGLAVAAGPLWQSLKSSLTIDQPTDQPTDQPEEQPADQPSDDPNKDTILCRTLYSLIGLGENLLI